MHDNANPDPPRNLLSPPTFLQRNSRARSAHFLHFLERVRQPKDAKP
jgi:hypothetical protein